MPLLGREAILRLVRYKLVEVPELGGQIRLRSLSGSSMAILMQELGIGQINKENMGQLMRMGARLLIECWVDESGSTVLQLGDAEMVLQLPLDTMTLLAEALMELNGLKPDAVEVAKKNSSTIQNGDFGSSSP